MQSFRESNFPIGAISSILSDLDLEIPPIAIIGELCLINLLISLFRFVHFSISVSPCALSCKSPVIGAAGAQNSGPHPKTPKRTLRPAEQTIKGERYRLNIVVVELDKTTSVEYQIALLAFINCVIISAATLQDRIRMRNEFIGEYLIYNMCCVCIHAFPIGSGYCGGLGRERVSLQTKYLTVQRHE